MKIPKTNKRFNLKKAMKRHITIRAKILCFISWLFKIRIEVPNFELEVRQKHNKRNSLC